MHHTKQKGDIGLTKIIADLTGRGYSVLLPISEHQAYDLVVDINGVLLKTQVKYISVIDNTIKIDLRSCYQHGKRTIISAPKIKNMDLIGIYCPDTDECYYLKTSEISKGGRASLKIQGNKNKSKIAKDYTFI